MGREVRRVPADWVHPKKINEYTGEEIYQPKHDGSCEVAYSEWLNKELPEWIEGRAKWSEGLVSDYSGGWKAIDEKYAGMTYEEYAGTAPTSPDPAYYMPDWPEEQRTHYMMYEDTSEGTPISPAFATPEELARWLADTGASSFGSSTATYEQWLRVCNGGFAPSMVIDCHGIRSGVEALSD